MMDLPTTLTSSTRSMILTLTSLSIVTSSARLWQLSPTVVFPSSLLQSSVVKGSLSLDSFWNMYECTSAAAAFSIQDKTRQDKTSLLLTLSSGRHHHQSIDLIMSSCFGDLALRVHQMMLSYWPRITIWYYSGENFPCIKCHQLIATLTYALRIIPPC